MFTFILVSLWVLLLGGRVCELTGVGVEGREGWGVKQPPLRVNVEQRPGGGLREKGRGVTERVHR